MLEVSGVSRRYGQLLAVDNVSFSVGKSEIVGLLGHNGAGKTTIMKMLSGYLEPDDGQIRIAGVDLDVDTIGAQRSLGYLPENLPVYPELSIADYLDYAAELKGLGGQAKSSELARVVNATDLQSKLLDPISTLSRGYKQRVGVAQALLGRPGMLIMDEPTNGLDPTQTEQMRALLRSVAQDATVIVSTHILQEVNALCDRVLILNNGKLAVDARLEELRQSKHVILSTTMHADEVASHVEVLPGVERCEQLTGHTEQTLRFRLTLNDSDPQHVCAAVARAIVGAGAEIHELTAETQDLESLFRSVSSSPSDKATEASGHAA